MNNNSNGENFVLNKKRKHGDIAPVNKRPRIVRDNRSDHSWDTGKQNSLYYLPTPKSHTSPIEKSLNPNNSHIASASRKYSANERLKSIRKNLQLSKPQNSQHSNNNNNDKVTTTWKSPSSGHPTAKPSSLQERINSIRESSGSLPRVPNVYGYFTSAQSPSKISPSKSTPNSFNNLSNENINESDDSMEWSYIEEKKILSKINEIRNEDAITRVTPSTLFQECVAKELMDIPINDTILKDIYIVVDTNIFISQLEVITKLLEIKVNGVASPIVLIPWMVIQELDFLKDGRTDGNLKKKSQLAVRFINEKLSTKHPRVKGQSVRDAAQQNFSSKNADDSILHCCLQVVEKHNRAMLLSNDVNLRNKAIIHGIDAYSHSEIVSTLDPYRGVGNNYENFRATEIELCFKNLFSFIIFMQLKESYGSTLNHMQPDLKNPPWTVIKCLNLFQRFWQPIFSMFLQKQFFHKVTQYVEFMNKHGNIDTFRPTDLKNFVEYGLAICVYLKNSLQLYEDTISECINSVENIVKTFSLPDTFIEI